jgi:transcriptional regulator with XRE-family HTH domain
VRRAAVTTTAPRRDEGDPFERLGQRIAELRRKHGLTQQQMADRLAISRVAVSHIESSLTVPSERTVTLIAGLFKLEPWELVRDTDYPQARAERLPAVVARHTQAELVCAVVDALIESLGNCDQRAARIVLEPWQSRIAGELDVCADERERSLLVDAQRRIAATCRAWRRALERDEPRREHSGDVPCVAASSLECG